MDNRHTYDYGVIGNCAYTAHIKKDTNIAWMCWPRFDSSFIFGNMIDDEKGGEFSALPAEGNFDSRQYYLENTNVLCTEITSATGKYRVTDFAPRYLQFERSYKPLMLIRKIEPISEHPNIKVICSPVGDYGETVPERSMGSNHIRYIGLDAQVRLTTNISLSYLMKDQEFVLNETKYLVLTFGPPLEADVKETGELFLNRTVNYWHKWVKTASIANFYQKAAIRSALTLKIHQFEDTGAIVAATTTSLPESPGSTRNWDYRFCWMRDTFYTLNAFNNIGHFEELEKYFHYIMNITSAENDRYQPLFGIGGEKDLIEIETNLKGYQGNQPVRVGNQAYEHIQNDVYGQVLLSLLPLYYDQRIIFTERYDSGDLIHKTLGLIEKTMEQTDAGLWEFRNLSQHHCYTYLFHWAGSMAAEKIAVVLKDEKMGKLAKKLGKIAKGKIEQCYSVGKKGYSQAIGTDRMDASCLQLINMNYLDNNSDRAKEHLKAMEKDLKASNGLFYRYKHQDDFGEPETTFLICAFWYVEALACVGRLDEAIEYFDNLVGYSNHVGLLSEDVNEKDGSMWGNFPQAYSHVGLLNAAHRIAKKLDMPDFR
ncbi:Glucoamylase (glucan-1,4-alpha-glucosidase), GH15 family [Reichenbachiella faecimaris]|uniref:Glucoamylase (Glucan-1,4-alpha-glucosidase), GH15 family n=1 Tax=Reichenbachiella faecimaris TaxID=692418 RepID=A0A1W2GD90_REIFA|nr:glycoside hydrolase family 15 protein [Reichenbachiella faecimaris]SMD34484.1 Glucoamylase (glucan-1,4-alpha-glucosidase), GH15 family [Reichenbachiella faecimaris]